MTDAAARLREIVRGRVEAEGLHPLAARTGLSVGQIRSICAGRAPLISTVSQACAALDLELVIRPRAPGAGEAPAAVPAPPSPRPGGAPGAALEAVSDRRLAELIAAVADEYEALDPVGQASMLTRIWGLHPELRERADRAAGRRLARLARG